MVTTSKTSDTSTRFDALPRIPGEAQVEARVSGSAAPALSFAQERVWFLSQINPEDTAANIAQAVRIAGPLNREVLGRSLQSLVYRHEALRTTFATTELYAGIDSRPVQLVGDTARFPLDFVDISETPEEEIEALAKRLMHERLRQKFDLSL